MASYFNNNFCNQIFTLLQDTEDDPFSLSPSMVKVFPVPVCPYANTVQL